MDIEHPVKVPGKVRVESVGALIARCEETAKTLSQYHPFRNLIMNCAWAMRQLVDRVDAAESKLEKLDTPKDEVM